MTFSPKLTEEQKRFAEHRGGAFVHACPGAGKTFTIISRVARMNEFLLPRRGVAVVSFTNSAVDKFREDCRTAALESVLRHPSFMGTMDAFVRQFLVVPTRDPMSATAPLIIESWDNLAVEIRLMGHQAFRGVGVSLDCFDPVTNNIDPATIGHPGLRNHVRQHQARYQQVAASRRQALLAAGYLSAADARASTQQLVRDSVRGEALGRALSARFQEVIVDEAQDCNPLDLEILYWLRQHGAHVTLVCDPDQAIYGFRHGSPNGLLEFRTSYPTESVHTLTGNFRSSPAICKCAATMRNTGNADEALGECAAIDHPVIILTYGRQPDASIGRAFLAQLAAHGLSRAKSIVLAHANKAARRATGDSSLGDSAGTSRVEVVAHAVADFWSSAATSRSKEAVLRSVEALLLDLMGMRDGGEHVVRALQRTGIDKREHRRKALKLLMGLPKTCVDSDTARVAWIDRLHNALENLQLDLRPGQTVRGFFRRPSNRQWSSCLLEPLEGGLICSTIHEAKGRQFDAVCVVVPPNRAPENRTESLFTSWENRTEEEAKRVLYVGVTRSRKLVVLAIPVAYADRCLSLMVRGGVPYVRQDLVGTA